MLSRREAIALKTKLTLQEKLRDLRDEKKMTLSELAEATGIPLSTLQRMEGQEDIRVGYQDVAALATFYGVSTDYLFGLTDNRRHRHIELDALRLSDEAVTVLKDGRLNNRLIGKLLSHPDFPGLLRAMEVYIDRKILPQMNTMNAMYKIAESAIREQFDVAEDDAVMASLQEAVVDEDEYLRYRISERFNGLMKSLFDAHKKDALPEEQAGVLQELRDSMRDYPAQKEKEEKERWRLTLLAKQLGLNISELSDEEIRVLIKSLQKAEKYKQAGKRR
jgi:transcriptional regulator with XRE-family HTH domain